MQSNIRLRPKNILTQDLLETQIIQFLKFALINTVYFHCFRCQFKSNQFSGKTCSTDNCLLM